jgi:hypothetical protein
VPEQYIQLLRAKWFVQQNKVKLDEIRNQRLDLLNIFQKSDYLEILVSPQILTLHVIVKKSEEKTTFLWNLDLKIGFLGLFYLFYLAELGLKKYA